MARVKSDAVPQKRAMLNTTINEEILNDFKTHCKELGLPMNLLLELFMKEMIAGQFRLKFGKANELNVDLMDDRK